MKRIDSDCGIAKISKDHRVTLPKEWRDALGPDVECIKTKRGMLIRPVKKVSSSES